MVVAKEKKEELSEEDMLRQSEISLKNNKKVSLFIRGQG